MKPSVVHALLAAILFGGVLGMLAIVAGGVVLSWPDGDQSTSNWIGPLLVCTACVLCVGAVDVDAAREMFMETRA